jgi:DNA-binding IclR family transcriptional regulator
MMKTIPLRADDAISPTRKGKTVGAAVSVSHILRFLQRAKEPVSATQIARAVGMNASTCFNLLRTLVDEDFVALDEQTKKYILSLGVVALAKGALDQNLDLKVLQPRLQEFALRHDVLVACAKRISRDRAMLVIVAETDAPIRLHGRIGTTIPLLLGASGRVFAAFSEFTDLQLEEEFRKLRFARSLEFPQFLSEVQEVRSTGWAIDDSYYVSGMVSVAAPIMGIDNYVSLCCAAMMFNGQHDPKRIASIAAELVAIGLTSSRSRGPESSAQVTISSITERTERPPEQESISASGTAAKVKVRKRSTRGEDRPHATEATPLKSPA